MYVPPNSYDGGGTHSRGAVRLTYFVRITGFLTAVLQNYARQHKISIDALHFSFHVTPNPKVDQEGQLSDMTMRLDVTDLGFQVLPSPH